MTTFFTKKVTCLSALGVILLFGSVHGGFERVCTPEIIQNQRLGVCGSPLADTLRLSCMYPDFFIKRNEDKSHHRNDSVTENGLNWKMTAGLKETDKKRLAELHVSRGDALSFIVKRGVFHERNVVCECCIFGCNVREMREYC